MATHISEYLNKLLDLKKTLATNLTARGQTSSEDEGFSSLIPKVLNIGKDNSMFIGNTNHKGNFSDVMYVLSSGNFVVGEFMVPTSIKKGFTIDTGLSSVNGFIYFLEDTSITTTNECGLYGIVTYNTNGETEITQYLQGKNRVVYNTPFSRCSDWKFNGGVLTLNPDMDNENYTVFKYGENVKYYWLAW